MRFSFLLSLFSHWTTNRASTPSVAKVTEITATSKKSFEDAIEQGIKRASKTLHGIEGAWVQDQKVKVDKGKVVQYPVNLKVTFVLDGERAGLLLVAQRVDRVERRSLVRRVVAEADADHR